MSASLQTGSRPDSRLVQAVRHLRAGRGKPAGRAALAAAALEPRGATAFAILAELAQASAPDRAAALYAVALRAQPGQVAWMSNRGACLLEAGEVEAAAAALTRAAHLAPGLAPIHGNLGWARQRQDKRGAARRRLTCALALDPKTQRAWLRLAQVLIAEGDHARGARLCRDLARRLPELADVVNSLGVAARLRGRVDVARRAYDRAVALEPLFSGALYNAGNLALHRSEPERALAFHRRAIAIRPDEPEYHWNHALGLLLAGHWRRGWEEYEWRWRWPGFSSRRPEIDAPLWRGEPPAGRRIHLVAEQGLGDALQFCRHAPQLAAAGARVTLAARAALVPLLRGLDGVEAVVEEDAPTPPCDAWSPLMSLPRHLGHGPPPPYLTAPRETPFQRDARPTIALVWAGNPDHGRDAERSVAFSRLAPLLDLPARFVSLQLGDARAQVAPPVEDLGDLLVDLAATAAILDKVDALVSVDTSVAHLAGALDVPVFLLISAVPDFRWGLRGGGSLWYPRTRLFRQPRPGDWDPVIVALKRRLSTWIGHPSP